MSNYVDAEIERWLNVRQHWNLRALRRDAPILARHLVDVMDLGELQALNRRLEDRGCQTLTSYVNLQIDRFRDARRTTTVSGGLPTLGRGHR